MGSCWSEQNPQVTTTPPVQRYYIAPVPSAPTVQATAPVLPTAPWLMPNVTVPQGFYPQPSAPTHPAPPVPIYYARSTAPPYFG
jgi:hypothetical protein